MAETETMEQIIQSIKEIRESIKESGKEFDRRLQESENRIEQDLKQSRQEFDKKIGEISGTLGKFVEGLVEPRLKELFIKRGIPLRAVYKNIEIANEKNEVETEIDLLLVNKTFSLAVEIKTTLTVDDVKTHLERLDKLQKFPIRAISGTKLIGAVAGMRMESDADKYAYRKGLFVLKQKGEIVEIANDDNFQPREWIIE